MGDRLAAWVEAVASRVFGPVFALDASRVGRRLSTFLVRWAYLLVLASVLGVFFNSWSHRLNAPDGRVDPAVLTRFAESFFWVYAITQFLAVAVLTPAFTAATITDEKERKTLHFLLVTDLSGREIVFGKLAARVGALFMFVLAGLPVVAIMQFFGGIEPRLLFLVVGMTLMTVVSLSAISVCMSSLVSRTRDAVMLAYGLPAAYLYLSFEGLVLFRRNSEWRGFAESFAAGNPFFVGDRLDLAFAQSGIPPVALWYLVFHGVVAVLGFALAAARLRAGTEERGTTGAKPRGAPRRFVAWLLGRRTEARQHPPVGDAPVLWREVHVDPGSGSGIVQRLFVFGILVAIVIPLLAILHDTLVMSNYSVGRYRQDEWYYFHERIRVWVCAVTGGLGSIMLLRATVRGAAALAGERDRDTWVSLLSTPLSTREILHGKWVGCILGQRGTMYLLAAVWAVGVLTGSVAALTLIPAGVALASYLTAFAWLGLRCSVTARNARVAIARAVPAAIFLGGGYWFFLGFCCFGIGARGAGEAVAYATAGVVGVTPPFVLGGLPALDSEVLHDMNRSRQAISILATMMCSGVVGVAGWFFLGRMWAETTQTLFDAEANRTADDGRAPLATAASEVDGKPEEPEPW
jgi:ABC-type transport system involved in multi-copper enzyme maturation permease subunit